MTASTETFNNVNFQILLKQHDGNYERALRSWERICALGGFGSVSPTYAGGLDISGIRIARDEADQGGNDEFHRMAMLQFDGRGYDLRPAPPPSHDNIHEIEDIASGDKPKSKE